jgi:hypothetical protein
MSHPLLYCNPSWNLVKSISSSAIWQDRQTASRLSRYDLLHMRRSLRNAPASHNTETCAYLGEKLP